MTEKGGPVIMLIAMLNACTFRCHNDARHGAPLPHVTWVTWGWPEVQTPSHPPWAFSP